MNLSQLFCDINDRLVHLDIDDKDKKTELVLLGSGYQREDFRKIAAHLFRRVGDAPGTGKIAVTESRPIDAR